MLMLTFYANANHAFISTIVLTTLMNICKYML